MQAWNNFLNSLEQEMGGDTVKKWLHSLKIKDYDACNLYLEAKDAFQAMWFEEHIRKKADRLLFNNNKKKIQIHLSIKGQSNEKNEQKKTEQSPSLFKFSFNELDPLMIYEHFVPSEANLLAHKLLFKITNFDPISSQVISSSGEFNSFNPIYLFGPKGTGKTHLLMATAHVLKSSNQKPLYVRSDTFTEHVVSAIRAGEMSRFREAYRSVDVLLIDDVHLFSRKWATQEELFHTFNALHLAGKQIILTAQCAPQELQHIEPRLVSRFEWGIVLPLDPLPQEDLKKIVQKKAGAFDTKLHPKVEEFLVQSFSRTTNSLTKALESLLMRHLLRLQQQKKASAPITVELARHLLSDLIEQENQKALSPEKIVQIVSEYFGITARDVLSKNQKREFSFPRQLAIYFCRYRLKLPYTKIGDIFSRDHSTIMSSIKCIEKLKKNHDKELLSAHHGISKLLHR